MRLLAALALALTYTAAGFAQTRTPAPNVPVMAQPMAIETDARQVREQFEALLVKYPPEVGRILKMDPTMLTNEQYLVQYPGVQQFLAAHPEIARNPSFYLEFVRTSYDYPRQNDPQSRVFEVWRDLVQSASVFAFVAFVSAMLAWLVRTTLNHRRWLRASKVQTEVHNKLLERFAGTNELLSYVQSAAGRRFLEAAPIPLDAATDRPMSAPLNRILWSVQAGIVLVVGGLGFQYVSANVFPDVGQGVWTIGVLATAFGLGFILAGAFSYMMSRRLGLLAPPAAIERGDSPAA